MPTALSLQYLKSLPQLYLLFHHLFIHLQCDNLIPTKLARIPKNSKSVRNSQGTTCVLLSQTDISAKEKMIKCFFLFL